MDVDKSHKFVSEFAISLHAALNRIGFVAAPQRLPKLVDILELSKPQVYRILTGKSAPSLASMVQFRSMGISIDTLLDQLRGASIQSEACTASIDIAGIRQECKITTAKITANTKVIAIPSTTAEQETVWQVQLLQEGQTPPLNALAVQNIYFAQENPALAVVEDHAATLKVLCKQLEPWFDTVPFSSGQELLGAALERYSAFLIDWKLPDIQGEELIMALRKASKAPIFIVTGQRDVSHQIARVLELEQVFCIMKPIDEIILSVQIAQAIRKTK